MLEQIRRNVRHPYIQVALGLIILVFILFFGWSMQSQRPTYVAKVNGDTIDVRAYQQIYNGLVRLYQEAFQGNLTTERLREMDLGRRALDQLVDRTLLLQEASRRGLKVSEEEVRAAIQGVPAFQQGGAFDKALYLRVLEANRLTPLEFETTRRTELLLQKAEAAIRSEASVGEAEVEQEYRDRHTTVAIEYVTFPASSFEAGAQPSEGALAAFYGAEGESFRRPERRAARYVLFAPAAFERGVEVTDREVEEEYNLRGDEYSIPEAVRARHLLVRVGEGTSEKDRTQAREKIERLRTEILGGKPFAEVARLHSEDPGSKDRGGDVGLFERGRMVPEFEAAAFALEPGKVSEPVETAFGYHLIWVDEHRPASRRTLEEVRSVVAGELRRKKALEQAYTAADNTLMDLEDKKTSWEALASSRTVSRTPLLAQGDTPSGIEKPAEFMETLFALDPAKAGQLLETQAGTFLVSVGQVQPSEVPPLADVKAQVIERFRKAEGKRTAEARAKEFLTRATGEGWEVALRNLRLTAQLSKPFPRKGGSVDELGWGPALKDAAFALKSRGDIAPAPVDLSDTYYAFRLAARVEPDLSRLGAEQEQIRAELLPRKQEERFQEHLAALRKTADLEVNEELIL